MLFGSVARGTVRPDSDVDIGILPVDELAWSDELALVGALSSALRREVDLVRLDRASTLLRWRIARDGIVLTSAPPYEAVRFRAEAASEYADFAPALHDAAERFRRKVAGGGMADAILVLKELAILREHVARMRQRRPAQLADFESNSLLQDAVALSLLVAVQEAADIALHVASDEGWTVAGSFAEAFEVLVQHGVIDAELCRRMVGISAVRNRIAHGYASVDVARLWTELPVGIDALERYDDAIAQFAAPPP